MFDNPSIVNVSGGLDNLIKDEIVLVSSPQEAWEEQEEEGQLAVDVAETATELVVMATMAGTRPEDIELHLHNDFLTIRGRRAAPFVGFSHHFIQECYWGAFSRTVVLPVDVKSELAQSEYRNGVLTIRLPKMAAKTTIPLFVVEE